MAETIFDKPLDKSVGNLSNLNTTAKTSLVEAINEINTNTVSINSQTLTDEQKNQICSNLGISRTTMREVPLAVAVSDWSGSGTSWTATFTSAYITTTCKYLVVWDSSIRDYAKSYLNDVLKSGGGGLTITSAAKPTGTITGTVLVWDNDDGKPYSIVQDTVTSIQHGGTGESTIAGVKSAFGVTALDNDLTRVKKFGIAEIQASLSTSVTIAKNTGVKIFDSVNLKTGNVFTTTFEIGSLSNIPDNLKGMVYLWSSSSACVPVDTIVWNNGTVSLTLRNVGDGDVTVSQIRLLLFGYYS